MSKATQFIKDFTQGCSNELVNGGFHEWLTPEQAIKATELTKEEFIDSACVWLKKNLAKYAAIMERDYLVFEKELVADFRKYLEGLV